MDEKVGYVLRFLRYHKFLKLDGVEMAQSNYTSSQKRRYSVLTNTILINPAPAFLHSVPLGSLLYIFFLHQWSYISYSAVVSVPSISDTRTKFDELHKMNEVS